MSGIVGRESEDIVDELKLGHVALGLIAPKARGDLVDGRVRSTTGQRHEVVEGIRGLAAVVTGRQEKPDAAVLTAESLRGVVVRIVV